METKVILRSYSYFLLTAALAVFLYAVLRIGMCAVTSVGVHADFCKLSGFSYWNFYGLPLFSLSMVGFLLPKLTESDKSQKIVLILMLLTTFRLLYFLIAGSLV